MPSFNNYGPAIRDLQRDCAFKLRHVRVIYRDGDGQSAGRPAQGYLDAQNRTRYRPWQGVTGGKWIKGVPVIGAKVKQFEGDAR